MIVYVILFAVIAVILTAYYFIQRRGVKNMTYDKLMEKSKKFIDEGRFNDLKCFLLKHPKLLLVHFNELQTVLTEYAQSVENNKSKGGE